MLQITGKTLDVTTETVHPPGGSSFESTTISLLAGKASVERVRVGRDFEGVLPKEGEEVTLSVVVSAYASRNGAGYRLTALGRVGGQRIAAAS
jgi:hypothetical protein